jgi:uncharacterized membrane protein YheB (UPF0754 family)
MCGGLCRNHDQLVWSQGTRRSERSANVLYIAPFHYLQLNILCYEQMLFYPIEYVGVNILERPPFSPYGYFGWQGVVPTKTQVMAERLVKIVTEKLLSLKEAFARLQPADLAQLLLPTVSDQILLECGPVWHALVRPVLPILLPVILNNLNHEIDDVLNLRKVVLEAFVRDKAVLVDLFQKVGRVELEFLVNSGFGFGFVLGLGQMVAWVAKPMAWTLPAAGALVGYVTNWVAIKLLFEPAEPVELIPGILTIQGLFESRQIEVSDEFGAFMEHRVLNSKSLLLALTEGGDNGKLSEFLRRQLPFPVPSHVVLACVHAIEKVAENPLDPKYSQIHSYVKKQLNIEDTLCTRLKLLNSIEFEDLLHPVFQEDEITLIATGGVLGAIAGAAQTQLGWGGPKATRNAIITIVASLLMSVAFYTHQKVEKMDDDKNPVISSHSRPNLRRRSTIIRIQPLEDEQDWEESGKKHSVSYHYR